MVITLYSIPNKALVAYLDNYFFRTFANYAIQCEKKYDISVS